jgi:hypothetical protein
MRKRGMGSTKQVKLTNRALPPATRTVDIADVRRFFAEWVGI